MYSDSFLDGITEVRHEGQRLTIRPPADVDGSHFAGYHTAEPVNFAGGIASVGVAQPASAGASTNFGLVVDENNWYGFRVTDGNLVFLSTENGTPESASVPFDQTAHRYWRLRHDAANNVLYWETSATGASWHVRHAVTPQASIASVEAELSAGTTVQVADPGAAIFDSFSLRVLSP